MFYYANQLLKVIKVKRIISLSDNYIEIQLSNYFLKIYGMYLYICCIEGKEISIKGKINKILLEEYKT